MNGLDQQDLQMALTGYQMQLAQVQARIDALGGRRPAATHRAHDGRKSSWTPARRKAFSLIRKKVWAAKKRSAK